MCHGAAGSSKPEGLADWQFALSDILEPHLVHHGITVVKGESPTVGQEGGCEQAVSHKLLLLGIKRLQRWPKLYQATGYMIDHLIQPPSRLQPTSVMPQNARLSAVHASKHS